MEIFNNGSFSDERDIPNKTPINDPFGLNLDNDSYQNPHIAYYQQNYGNSYKIENTDNNPFQNLLYNHPNKGYQKGKANDAINSLANEEKSTYINTNEIGMPQPNIVNIVSKFELGTPFIIYMINELK